MQGSQEDKKDLLQDLQSELKGKTIIDVTTAAYLKDESKWGQMSTTHMNQEALAVPAKWVRCWNTVFVVSYTLKLCIAEYCTANLIMTMLSKQNSCT